MCLLFETIRITDGTPQHLRWHEQRMNQARKEVWTHVVPFVLEQILKTPGEYSAGFVRCNVFYDREDVQQVTYTNYDKRVIRSLKMVIDNDLDYHLKYADRSALESLFGQRGTADEIIIVKNGLITDTSMSNLIFFDGKNWFTPVNPLLKGTCRNRLLAEGRIFERAVRPADLFNFTGCKLINALRDPDEENLIPVSEIS